MTTKQTHITQDMKIAVVKKENPFTEGTKQFKRAAAVLACSGKTVEDARKKGADQWTVRYMVQNKFVKVAAAT
jgi:hypothetical protein